MIGGSQSPSQTIAIIRGTRKATDFKFRFYIHSVHPDKSGKAIKNFGEKGAWAYPGTAQIF